MRAGERREAARARMGDEGLTAMLVAPGADLTYLTGYRAPPLERLTCLVLPGGSDPVLVVPDLERALAEQQAPGIEIAAWAETDDPYALVAGMLAGERVACDDRMWASHVLALQRALPDAVLTPASTVLGPLRAVKDQEELARLKRAARSADEVYHRMLEERLEGRTEREVAAMLSELLVEMGHETVGFTIVGSGPNSASPHHEPTDRGIRQGDAVVLDFGGTLGGYGSDISRTVSVARPSPELEEIHAIVLEAQDRAVRAIRPGMPAQEVDRVAREVIRQAGYGDRFIHRTGHGIGLEAHEHPYLVEGNEDPLRPGMCFSVEPGIYLDGRLGVRIEDIVVVTETGWRRLNLAPRELAVTR